MWAQRPNEKRKRHDQQEWSALQHYVYAKPDSLSFRDNAVCIALRWLVFHHWCHFWLFDESKLESNEPERYECSGSHAMRALRRTSRTHKFQRVSVFYQPSLVYMLIRLKLFSQNVCRSGVDEKKIVLEMICEHMQRTAAVFSIELSRLPMTFPSVYGNEGTKRANRNK